MSPASPIRWSHIGLCVTDLERSMRFYCDGLGCEPAERYELDGTQLPGLAEALEVGAPASVVSQMITHGALRIELIEWRTPPAEGTPSSHRNQVGLTHLSFFVDEIDAAAERLVEHGGRLLEGTRQSPGIDLLFVADPDGTRVEVMAAG
jgi:catechol 2,3-dioxygenase-like lactoylglutathione lyase family enzyme